MFKQFIKLLICVCLCSTTAGAYASEKRSSKSALKAHIPSAEEIAAMESRAVDMINAVRADHDLPPLKIWKDLVICARGHSTHMANGVVDFGHDGFDTRADHMNTFASLSRFGENVAYTFHHKDPVKESVSGWMDSPPHRKNILGDYKETGIGISYSKDGKCYLTQLFAKRMR